MRPVIDSNNIDKHDLFVKTVLREKKIPFEIKQADPFFSEENQKYIMKSVKELKSGKGKKHDLIEVEDE